MECNAENFDATDENKYRTESSSSQKKKCEAILQFTKSYSFCFPFSHLHNHAKINFPFYLTIASASVIPFLLD